MAANVSVEFAYKLLKVYEKNCKPLCQEIRMPQTAFDILMFLANNPDYNTARDIVEIRRIKANLVSVNVDKLVQEGYLERRPAAGDRRKTLLKYTQKAKPVIERGHVLQAGFFAKIFDNIDVNSRQVFFQVIEMMEANLDRMAKGYD